MESPGNSLQPAFCLRCAYALRGKWITTFVTHRVAPSDGQQLIRLSLLKYAGPFQFVRPV
jgi:hypothetical protein